MALLVILYCLTIGLTYDRAGFTNKSLRNHVQKYYVIFLTGGCVRTLRTLNVYATGAWGCVAGEIVRAVSWKQF